MMKLAPKTLTGTLHNLNKGACDWGWQGLVAYGCQNIVTVIDPKTVQVIQTLDKHKGCIVKVKWSRENYHHDLARPYTLRLASADNNGRIIIWDVAQAAIRAEFSDSSKPVADLEWLSTQDASHDLLAALHPPYSVILWNTDTGTKLWKKSYTETLTSFAFDPFDPARLAFLGQDCIVFVDDFSVSKVPSSNGKKYYISSPSGHSSAMSHSSSSDKLGDRKTSKPTTLSRRMTNILIGEGNKRVQDEESVALNECLQLTYHQACRNHIILVYPREILILDLNINQTVGIIPMERSGSPFMQVLPLRQRDVLLSQHENGIVAVRVRRRNNHIAATPAGEQADDSPTHMLLDVTYDLRCQSDPLRITKSSRVFGLVHCPVTEMKVVLLMSDSRLLVWELKTIDYQWVASGERDKGARRNVTIPGNNSGKTLLNVLELEQIPYDNTMQQRVAVVKLAGHKSSCQALGPVQIHTIPRFLAVFDEHVLFAKESDWEHWKDSNVVPAQSPLYTPGVPLPQFSIPSEKSNRLQMFSDITCPKTALSDLIGQTQAFVTESMKQPKHGVLLKFVLTGLLNGVAPPPLVMRMCPPLTTKNWAVYQPRLALGTSQGSVQVYNLSSGHLSRELSIHSCTVRGIEWVSLTSFLSFAHHTPGVNGLVKNELVMTDIQTGKNTPLRTNREEESPIEAIKISHLKQYFVIVFKDKPFELWDLRTNTMLRQMPRNFPQVTALEWSPSHNLKSLKKKLQSQDSGMAGGVMLQTQPDMSASSSTLDSASRSDSKQIMQNLSVKEHFVFTDSDGLLYHFIVEGNMIKDGSKIPPDGGMGSITSIAWKGETLVLGDVEGNLNLWDLKAKLSRTVPTHRGWIRKLKYAPGRGNMKLLVLYNDGADVWDAKDVELISIVKTPKDLPKVSDGDWAASDKPVLACADGCVRVLDIRFKVGSCPIEDVQLTEPLFCPHLLPPRAAMLMKQLLAHQPWNQDYSLTLDETEENADICRLINEQTDIIDSELKEYIAGCHFGSAHRSLITARLFGDESELLFWTLALHYLRAEKAEPMSRQTLPQSASQQALGDLFIPTTPAHETHDLLSFEDGSKSEVKDASSSWAFIKDRPLETCYDVLCDSITFQRHQLDRISLHDSKRVTYEHTKKCAENLMLLGQADRAVQLLLETEADNDNYLADCLRACLVASIRSSGASQSTIKLVATNLIANGKLSEGVQLLCLIDKGLDACRYLQTYGEWDKAAWLAKATLNYSECSEVMKRWSDHLSSPQVNQKSKAILLMLSLGQFVKVIEMLHGMRHFDRAALFIEACTEFELLDSSEETNTLVQGVFVEYARMLFHLGSKPGAEYYCHRAGARGEQLLREIEQHHASRK